MLLAALGLAAEAAAGKRPRRASDFDQLLRERGLDPQAITRPLLLTDEMRAWARAAVEGQVTGEGRLRALIERLLDPDHLRLEYAWGYTGTAVEVFEQRRANCLAFTNLFVSMAREVGLSVYYLLVRDQESFRKEGDLVVISDHVAVGWGSAGSRLVVDFSLQPLGDYRRAERIDDLTALALYYSNRGAESLQEDDVAGALEWLKTAVLLDPEEASSWVNYGVALRRDGQLEAAEAAYRKALEIDPRAGSAASNLASLLRLSGREAEAIELEQLLARAGGRNPYTYLALGDISVRRGRFDEAGRLYRRAINLKRRDAEPWAALGQLALIRGDHDAARRLLKKARKRDAEHPRAVQLAQALAGIDR
ncbi:MAG: tetratricopeptide repeat protein [Acidobacteria bacterium]|nr:MAG: tetratricopeptide repeat protein [Acidobacteriota bacterium]